MVHQYISRADRAVKTEELFGDRLVGLIYNDAREKAPALFKALTSARMSSMLGFVNYDMLIKQRLSGGRNMIEALNIDLDECLEPDSLDSPRKIFERKIRYWKTRPMPENCTSITSPADAKMLAGSLSKNSMLFIKEKFFKPDELLGEDRSEWIEAFENGAYAIFRLTPDKYHYNHTPVAGVVKDIYELDGAYHSCNPTAATVAATPISKNKRVVTIIDTDVDGGTRIGFVAMVEVAALMIGGIEQCYSEIAYLNPRQVAVGMFLKKGRPKSLFKPGSSTVVLLFEKNRIRFSPDIVENMNRTDVKSRFSEGFGRPLVETDVPVRSEIATKLFNGRSHQKKIQK